MSDATTPEMGKPEENQHVGRLALRLLLLATTTLQMLFIVVLTIFIIRGVSHFGDGREYVAISVAIMLLEIPFTIPAFILAFRGKALGIAACLAGFATFAYVIFWVQVYAEVTARGA